MNQEVNTKTLRIIVVVFVAACTILAVLLPLVLFHGKISSNSSSSEASIIFDSTIIEEEVFELPAEEVASENVASAKTMPTPKNFSKALEKDKTVTTQTSFEKPAINTPIKLLDVPYINQNGKYPTGCESVSAVMALNFAGYGISVNSFIDNYLDKAITPYIGTDGNYYGYDPREYFLGDPYSEKGWGCMAPVIITALNRCIDQSRHTVKNLTGSSLSSLRSYLDSDIPVIFWATQGMNPTRTSKTWTIVDTDRTYTWISPNHCLLLVGYDDTGYYFNDPLTHKNCRYNADIVENRFNATGRQAIIIAQKPQEVAIIEQPQDNITIPPADDNDITIPENDNDNPDGSNPPDNNVGDEVDTEKDLNENIIE